MPEIDELQLARVIKQVVQQEFVPQIRKEVQQLLVEERRRIVGGLPGYVTDRVREELFKAFGHMQDRIVDDVAGNDQLMEELQEQVEERVKGSREMVEEAKREKEEGQPVVRRKRGT